MSKKFDFLNGRLIHIKVFKDDNPMENFGFFNCVSFFETQVFGVISQYNRIISNIVPSLDERNMREVNTIQLRLDIYYYILTWDKIKEIFKKIKEMMNRIQNDIDDISIEFKKEYRLWRDRMDHLLGEFDDNVRNSYEHPKLKPMVCGNIIMWGSTLVDGEGNIKTHVESEIYSEVRKSHIDRVDSLRIDLIDLILKYFSDKPLSRALLNLRKDIEDNMDELIGENDELIKQGRTKELVEVFHRLMMINSHLAMEGIPLSDVTNGKIHSMIWSEKNLERKE